MTTIAGSTAVITGGASGLGSLLATRFAELGATVVLYDLDEAALESVARDVEAATGRQVHAFACDVADRDEVDATADEVRATVGPVHILVNNAGIVKGRRLMELSDDDIEEVFDVNVLGLFWVTRSFLAGMLERGHGHVVTIASAAGLVGVDRQTDYSASKHAATGFTESLRFELQRAGHPGVRTTLVQPFYIATGMFEGVTSRFPRLLPILEPDDVADRIVAAVQRDTAILRMPPIVNLLPALRLLPVGLFDRIMDAFGVSASMDDFVGRTAASSTQEHAPR